MPSLAVSALWLSSNVTAAGVLVFIPTCDFAVGTPDWILRSRSNASVSHFAGLSATDAQRPAVLLLLLWLMTTLLLLLFIIITQ